MISFIIAFVLGIMVLTVAARSLFEILLFVVWLIMEPVRKRQRRRAKEREPEPEIWFWPAEEKTESTQP